MIDRIITWCASNRFLVLGLTVCLVLWGIWGIRRVSLDAIPDLSDVQVIITTEWAGRSPDLVENQITFPLVSGLRPGAKVRTVRSFTDFGISYVYVIFDDGTDTDWARSRVAEQLQTLRSSLPVDVIPTMAPSATGVSWVFQYAITDESGRHTLDELRSLQDWQIRPALASVSGVAQIASIGGFIKQYQVNLDPHRLLAYRLSVGQVVEAIRANNADVEGGVLELSGREYMVRARGQLASVNDIKEVSLGADANGTPIFLRSVADVRIGPAPRRSVAELDGRGEAVGGIVVMRVGENALQVITDIKTRLDQVRGTLPSGVRILPVYDRSDLILGSIASLRRVLLEEAAIVIGVTLVFLFHFRCALIPVLVLLVTFASTFLCLWLFGISANIMSLGGIALAIGVLVDASIVLVENAYRRLFEQSDTSALGTHALLMDSALQVGRPVFLSLTIVVVSFAPVFLLQAEEGRMFRPLALTKSIAVAIATILAITLVPALIATLLGRRPATVHRPSKVSAVCARLYEPLLRGALRFRWAVLGVNAALLPIAGALYFTIGHSFMPPLYEGTLLYMPSAPPGLPITEASRLLQQQDRILRDFQEVERVFGSAGRADTPTDNSPLSMTNTLIMLKPRAQWRENLTVETLRMEMDQSLEFLGVPNLWTQPIRGRLDMLSTGVRSPVGVKILGADYAVVQELAGQVERIVRTVPGTQDAYSERVAEGQYVDVQIDRTAIARRGLTIQDVNDVVQSAIGGNTVSYLLEGRERYPINVRYQQDFRSDLAGLRAALVKTPAGSQVPLGDLAKVSIVAGPSMIKAENGYLVTSVTVDVATSDLAEYVSRARAAVSEGLKLPPGYLIEWSGHFEHLQRAYARLRMILPIVVMSIFLLLYLTFRSSSEALAVILSVAYAMTGGVILQWLLGYNFSVAVWIAYITLYGLAVQTGVVMVVYLQEAVARRTSEGRLNIEQDLLEATMEGAVLRLRPKLMTVVTTALGVLPILWSSGYGSDVMRPIAVPIVGGLVTSSVHVLIVTPIVFFLIKRRSLGLPINSHSSSVV